MERRWRDRLAEREREKRREEEDEEEKKRRERKRDFLCVQYPSDKKIKHEKIA
jgi:hypothetical protein